jgi:hypothetical protein
MTQTENSKPDEKKTQLLEEICENTRAIRRVTNRILDHLHEYVCKEDYDNATLDNDSTSPKSAMQGKPSTKTAGKLRYEGLNDREEESKF